MTASRTVDDISSAPGGKSGAEWTADVSDSVEALWALNGGMLTSVAGTNTITATVAVADGFTAYSDGMRFGFIAAASNTGPVEVNLSGSGGAVGLKALRDPNGDVLSAGSIVSGRYTEMTFYAEDDHFRLVSSGGTTNVTVQGGIALQRSAASRLAAAVASTTAATAVGSVSFQTYYTTSRVIVEGNASLVTQSGTEDVDGIVVDLRVDGVSVENFVAHCLPSMVINVPFYFSYLPGDTSTHTYAVYVSSTISSIYPKGANVIWATEFSPNA